MKYNPATAPDYLKGIYSDYQQAKEQLKDSYNIRDYLGKPESKVTAADKKTPEYKRYKNTVNKAVYRLTKSFKPEFAKTSLKEPSATNEIFGDIPLFDALRYTKDDFEGAASNYIQDLESEGLRVTLTTTIQTLDGKSTSVEDRVQDIQDVLERKYKEIRTYFARRRKEYEDQNKVKLTGKDYDKLVTCSLLEVSIPDDERVFLFLNVTGM